MTDEKNILWNIGELAAEVAAALAQAQVDQASGRVTEVPSTRTIRYYTTHGLLDPPLEFRGRTALYGRRHLLQLVAIKQLQARGLALEEVQHRVVGATDAALAALARVPEAEARARAPQSARRTEEFWAQAPAEPGSRVAPREEPLELLPAVNLGEGVALLLHGAHRGVHPDELEAIRVAAQPLIKLLKRRNILAAPDEEER